MIERKPRRKNKITYRLTVNLSEGHCESCCLWKDWGEGKEGKRKRRGERQQLEGYKNEILCESSDGAVGAGGTFARPRDAVPIEKPQEQESPVTVNRIWLVMLSPPQLRFFSLSTLLLSGKASASQRQLYYGLAESQLHRTRDAIRPSDSSIAVFPPYSKDLPSF